VRGLKIVEPQIPKGIKIYHNFIWEHEGLEGKPPTRASGIIVYGENKWVTLIQNAKKRQIL